MKKSLIYLFILLIGLSCQEDNNVFEDLTDSGGFVAFKETPPTSYNLLNLDNFGIDTQLIDLNNNATSYNLTAEYEGTEVSDFRVLTNFPANLVITLTDLLNAFGLTEDQLTLDSRFNFTATVTTPTGIFSGIPPDFNNDTNEEEGGNTSLELLGVGYKNAFSFRASFFVPPPKKIRGTSFEEPYADPDPDADYIRADGIDNDAEGELFNNPGERHVMHVSAGTGVDDEIGFKAEFISDGDGGFSNEEIGVTQKTEDVGAYIDGIQGYQVEDVDGILKLTFDRVAIPAEVNQSGVRIQTFFRDTDWEDDDRIQVYVTIEKRDTTTETLELFNKSGSDLMDIMGEWNLIDSGFLDDIEAYTLIIETNLDSTNEEAYYDEMIVYQAE